MLYWTRRGFRHDGFLSAEGLIPLLVVDIILKQSSPGAAGQVFTAVPSSPP